MAPLFFDLVHASPLGSIFLSPVFDRWIKEQIAASSPVLPVSQQPIPTTAPLKTTDGSDLSNSADQPLKFELAFSFTSQAVLAQKELNPFRSKPPPFALSSPSPLITAPSPSPNTDPSPP
eukprot:CAMPEP_0184728276 /NCGR_PEP_ID=MMETSP0314-20130426/39548_1 /TAXON_ID=38298 /ORGANISM="Rhodella maculata, Strain CCMP 736" /LENGTH=119 /DNA_ID=CAMNT_0027194083 /DNA_START=557 /DNA_END=913 /DNA_ORIENTATION=+